jgi:hypothetical protein
MNKTLISKIALGLLIISLPTFATGCGKKDDDSANMLDSIIEDYDATDDLFDDTFGEDEIISSSTNTDDSEEDEVSVISSSTKDESEKEESEKETSSSEVTGDSKTVTGEFCGFADDSSVEVKINGNYRVLKVEGSIKDILDTKNIGDTITFSYVDNGSSYSGQITSVK